MPVENVQLGYLHPLHYLPESLDGLEVPGSINRDSSPGYAGLILDANRQILYRTFLRDKSSESLEGSQERNVPDAVELDLSRLRDLDLEVLLIDVRHLVV